MRRIRITVRALPLTFAVILIVSSVCRADEPLIIGVSENVEPFAFENSGTIEGILIDLFKEVSKRAGFQAEYKSYPFKRLNTYLQNGTIDGTVAMYYRKERESYLYYSLLPVINSHTRVFVKKGREFPLHAIEELFGKKIGIIAGWTIDNATYNQAKNQGKLNLQEATHYSQNLKMLMAGRVDCVIMTEQLTWFYADKLGFGENIQALDMIFSNVRMYITISRKSNRIADPGIFMEKLNMAVGEVLTDGTYKKIHMKYGIKELQ